MHVRAATQDFQNQFPDERGNGLVARSKGKRQRRFLGRSRPVSMHLLKVGESGSRDQPYSYTEGASGRRHGRDLLQALEDLDRHRCSAALPGPRNRRVDAKLGAAVARRNADQQAGEGNSATLLEVGHLQDGGERDVAAYRKGNVPVGQQPGQDRGQQRIRS